MWSVGIRRVSEIELRNAPMARGMRQSGIKLQSRMQGVAGKRCAHSLRIHPVQGKKTMNGREAFTQNGSFQLMGLDVPVRAGKIRIALLLISLTLVSVPLIPFIGRSSDIFANWCGHFYLASLVVANLILACFSRILASAYRSSRVGSSAAGVQAHGDAPGNAAGDRAVGPAKPRILDLIILVAEVAFSVVLVRAFLNGHVCVVSSERL